MGWIFRSAHPPAIGAAIVFFLSCSIGCQLSPAVSTNRLMRHQQQIDPIGLEPPAMFADLQAQCAPPHGWRALTPEKTILYSHQQWKSPSGLSGVGVAYIKMPLPLSAKAIIWFAKSEYKKKEHEGDGKQLGQWTDALGREWFEGENNKFHVRGYVLARGFEAWIIYTGYRLSQPPREDEMILANRCQEKILPQPPAENPAAKTSTASAN